MSSFPGYPLMIDFFRNHLTEKYSYKARVRLRATLTNEDIARMLAEQRVGCSYETILMILNLGDMEKIEALANGYAITDGAFHASPSVTGRFDSAMNRFDAKEHTIGAVVKPSPTLRKTMKKCRVQVIGRAAVGPVIYTVEDVESKTSNKKLTPGLSIWIRGLRLKLVGDDPGVGIYFVPADAPGTRIGVERRRVVVNTPTKLLVQIPDLPAGKYFAEVTTQYTNGGTVVKMPRTYRLQTPLESVRPVE